MAPPAPASTMTTTVTLPPGSMRAAFTPASVDAAQRTAELVWTTGARVLRHGLFSGPWYEELSLAEEAVDLSRLNGGTAPLLASHKSSDLDAVIGIVERAWLARMNGHREGRARVRFSKRPAVDGVLTDVQDGIVRNVSVGYITHELEEVDPGDAKRGEPPVYRATRWEPVEISLVPVPADPGAGLRTGPDDPRRYDCAITPAPLRAAARPQPRRPAPARGGPPMPVAAARRPASLSAADVQPARARVAVPSLSAQRRQGMVDVLVHRARPAAPLTAAGREWLGRSLLELAAEVLRAQGLPGPWRDRLELAGVALNLVRSPHGFQTTSDFPGLLAQGGRTVLTQGYQAAPRTFLPWTREGSCSSYRQETRVPLGLGPSFLKIPEHGEYPRGRLTTGAAQPVQLGKFGRVLAFTREAMVNDDVGLFRRIPEQFATGAAALESDLVYGLLTSNPRMADGQPLFSAAHANLLPAADLTLDSLAAARQAMRTQTSPEGQPLNVEPRFLICGPALEMKAAQLLAPITIVGSTSQIVPQAYQALRLVVDPRITDTSFYLAASPNQVDTIEYDYLDSERGPQLDTYENWNIDGLDFKARLDFTAAVIDYRGLNQTPGLA